MVQLSKLNVKTELKTQFWIDFFEIRELLYFDSCLMYSQRQARSLPENTALQQPQNYDSAIVKAEKAGLRPKIDFRATAAISQFVAMVKNASQAGPRNPRRAISMKIVV